MANAPHMDELACAEAFLHANIPLTRAMGVRVLPDMQFGFAVEAPVALNYNHLRTGFGGSINAIATLAAYCFLWLPLGESCDVVVRESTIRFVRPAKEMIRACCRPPSDAELELLARRLAEKHRGHIHLCVSVSEDGVVAEFKGTFVAISRVAKS